MNKLDSMTEMLMNAIKSKYKVTFIKFHKDQLILAIKFDIFGNTYRINRICRELPNLSWEVYPYFEQDILGFIDNELKGFVEREIYK